MSVHLASKKPWHFAHAFELIKQKVGIDMDKTIKNQS